MINNVVLAGRLTKDPEIRMTQTGTKVCSFTLAVNRTAKVQGQPDADFINCVAWNKTAELMSQYLRKGSMIGVEGRIQTRNYDNQRGQRVYVTEVVAQSISFLDSRKQDNSAGYYPDHDQYQSNRGGSYGSNPGYSAFDGLDISSDDLPF